MLEDERETRMRELSSQQPAERFTSLQPTYEDSVLPDADLEWELDERS